MKLDEWMTQTGTSNTALANLTGSDRTTISRVRRGVFLPNAELMRQIYQVTEGKVSANDFVHEAA